MAPHYPTAPPVRYSRPQALPIPWHWTAHKALVRVRRSHCAIGRRDTLRRQHNDDVVPTCDRIMRRNRCREYKTTQTALYTFSPILPSRLPHYAQTPTHSPLPPRAPFAHRHNHRLPTRLCALRLRPRRLQRHRRQRQLPRYIWPSLPGAGRHHRRDLQLGMLCGMWGCVCVLRGYGKEVGGVDCYGVHNPTFESGFADKEGEVWQGVAKAI
jgi:hypothetical protein